MPTSIADDRMFSMKLPADLYDAVSEAARRDERSMAFIIRKALEGYFAARADSGHFVDSSNTSSTRGEIE